MRYYRKNYGQRTPLHFGKKGWYLESERHRLAAKGIRTKQRALPALMREAAIQSAQRAEAKKAIKVMRLFNSWQRLGKGRGRRYTFSQVDKAYSVVQEKGSRKMRNNANVLLVKIRKYESSHFIPRARRVRMQKVAVSRLRIGREIRLPSRKVLKLVKPLKRVKSLEVQHGQGF
jgi:hypothetical protein